ncbi:YbaB/EbfC family nucleoid-associated protein [Sphaerisporangium melleum]|uniref:YbaB/EbfC family nucleoid-associated protein n=1 Tax=Sphaerisporangium melleum TaxID=321316 RepID=UPI00166F2F92|nr:YbaB/EbfC family nucleoid-associated protein [Sphaerisporangium melleum]
MFRPDDFRLADLDRVVQESEQAVRRLTGVFDGLAAVRGEGEAAGGLVSAAVDGGGMIEEVAIDPRAMRMDSAAIAAAVTEAVRAAQQDAQAKSAELLREATGDEPPSLDPADVGAWMKDVAEAMGAPLPPDRP